MGKEKKYFARDWHENDLYIPDKEYDNLFKADIYSYEKRIHPCGDSLDDSFDKLYTFSRKHRYLPLPAGFVTESMYDGIMGDSDNMVCGVYRLNITNNTYNKLETILNDMEFHRSKYRYSILGLLFCLFNKAFEREDYCFCSQFVYRTLSESEAIQYERPSSLVRPMDLPDLSEAMEVFKGTIGDLRLNGLVPAHGEALASRANM